MKTILLFGGAAFVTLTTSAAADDLGVVAPVYGWAGLYIGINAGYGFGKSQTDALFSNAGMGTPLFVSSSPSRLDGLIAGVPDRL